MKKQTPALTLAPGLYTWAGAAKYTGYCVANIKYHYYTSKKLKGKNVGVMTFTQAQLDDFLALMGKRPAENNQREAARLKDDEHKTYQQICDLLGYRDRSGAFRAVKRGRELRASTGKGKHEQKISTPGGD